MKRGILLSIVMVSVGFLTPMPVHGAANAKLKALPLTQVTITDAFWQPRLEANRTSTLAQNLNKCEETGRLSNFARAAGRAEGKYQGAFFNDSDVYKVLEGAAYILALKPDKQLEARIDAIIDDIAAAQQPDGYLNAHFTLMEPDKRWTDLPSKHELYCAGHLFEAAVAYAQATGKTKLLDVARRFADHIDSIFGPDKRIGTPGHEEIELALIKLYNHTGEQRYRKLAEFFVDARGKSPEDKKDGPGRAMYRQAHLPVIEQKEIVGHAVRAMYLYCAVADLAALSGEPGYLGALDAIWHDVVDRKMYITGGVGARHEGEAFGGAYELPNRSAYAETCAGIGLALWSHRQLLLHADGQFADVLERVLYNHFLSSVSLEGDTFFYVNPLESDGQHHRQPWYGCACCPTNIVRVMPQIHSYAYAQNDDDIWVNLYIAGTATAKLDAGRVTLAQETRYPWSGQVKLTVNPTRAAEFGVHLRIPGWCDEAAISVNGDKLANTTPDKGYVSITREWEPGDVVTLDLPMPIRRIQAHPLVADNRGRLAIQRGPIVYCIEAADHDGRVTNLVLDRDAKLTEHFEPDLLGGVVMIQGQGYVSEAASWEGKLYQPVANAPTRPVTIKAIPYNVWDNRQPGEMLVWIPELTGLAE